MQKVPWSEFARGYVACREVGGVPFPVMIIDSAVRWGGSRYLVRAVIGHIPSGWTFVVVESGESERQLEERLIEYIEDARDLLWESHGIQCATFVLLHPSSQPEDTSTWIVVEREEA